MGPVISTSQVKIFVAGEEKEIPENTSVSSSPKCKPGLKRNSSLGSTIRKMIGGLLLEDDIEEFSEEMDKSCSQHGNVIAVYEKLEPLSTDETKPDVYSKFEKKQELNAKWLKAHSEIKTTNDLNSMIKLSTVAEHNKQTDCWTIYNGKVYDITPYLAYHPGGSKKLMLGAGTDCTKMFDNYHDWVDCHRMLSNCYVGMLETEHIETLNM